VVVPDRVKLELFYPRWLFRNCHNVKLMFKKLTQESKRACTYLSGHIQVDEGGVHELEEGGVHKSEDDGHGGGREAHMDEGGVHW
jgi:hypothetical protein